jgi:cytochrome c551
MKKTTYLAGIYLTLTLLTGCSKSNDFTPTSGMDGMDIYTSTCASCHGEKGGGKLGFLLKLAGSEASTEEIVGMIQKGGHIMPAFPNISAQQAELIAAYIKSL